MPTFPFREDSALVVIDVQEGIFAGWHPYEDYAGVIHRIVALIAQAREQAVPLIFVQHSAGSGDPLEPGSPGWPIDARLGVRSDDCIVHKKASDSFFQTELQARLEERGARHLVICGCWTEFCVDTTCRRAVTLGYDVSLIGNAHSSANTTLKASQVIAHHNALLNGFDAGGHSIRVESLADFEVFAKAQA